MNRSLERKIALGFVMAVAAVLAAGIAAWLHAQRVGRTVDWLEHTYQVRYEVESTLVHVLNMQTSVRGFMLTGESQFIDAYEKGIRDAESAIAAVAALTRDNALQQQRVNTFRGILEEIRDAYATAIAVRKERGLQAMEDPRVLALSRQLISRARSVLAELDQDERALLEQRRRDSDAAVGNVSTVVLVTVLLAALALITTLRYGLRDYRLRRQAEQELDDFFRLSLDPLSVVSPDGKFVRLNPAWESALGYPLSQMIGRPFLEFVHPDDIDRTMLEAKRVSTGTESVSFQNRYRARDGSWRWLEWNGAVVPSSGMVIAVARDITSRKENEARIAELNEHLQAQNSELEAFSYSVSHDLRAPLRHMTGFAHLLEKHAGATLDDKGRHYISAISGAALTMGKLIDDLLQFSRTARAPLVMQNVNHDALVREVIAALPRNGESKVEWRVGTLPTLPGDNSLLRQVWTNFIANAAKYSAKAQPHPVVEISATRDATANETVFNVRDNGVGFDPRYTEKLFQVFSRLHDAQEFEGTGIGLALVRRIVTRHGGRTWAQAEPGKGASFFFSLPDRAVRTGTANPF